MQQVRGEIVLLSDANTSIDASAARNLVRWFADSNVGAVCGKLVLIDSANGKNVDSLYWRYETFLKQCEGRLGALLGSNGAIYAIRRELFNPIPPQTILDDFCIPLLAKLRTDSRSCSTARQSREKKPPGRCQEFRRRVRIGAGGFQAIGMLWRLLNPRRRWIAFTFLSHKIMRWLCPFFLLGALLCSAMLWHGRPIYRWAMFAQIAFYVSSAVMACIPSRASLLRPLRLGTMFTSMNAALFLGFIRWFRGSQKGVWQRTERTVQVRRAA